MNNTTGGLIAAGVTATAAVAVNVADVEILDETATAIEDPCGQYRQTMGDDYCTARERYYEARSHFFAPQDYHWIVYSRQQAEQPPQRIVTINVNTSDGYDRTIEAVCGILTVEDEDDFARVLCDKDAPSTSQNVGTTLVRNDLTSDAAFCAYYDAEDFDLSTSMRYNLDNVPQCNKQTRDALYNSGDTAGALTLGLQCARVGTLRHMFVKRFEHSCPAEVAVFADASARDLELAINFDLDKDGLVGSITQRRHYYPETMRGGPMVRFVRPTDWEDESEPTQESDQI